MRIATWPLNGISRRLPYLLHWLHCRQPDIVALQKIQGSAKTFPGEALNCAGYHAEAVPPSSSTDFGVAVLVRKPPFRPKVLRRVLPGRQQDGARLLSVEVDGLIFLSIYVPAQRPERIAWLGDLVKYVDEQLDASKRVVLCGDFNVNEKWATKEERRQLELLGDAGYADLYCALRPRGRRLQLWK